jgi:aspartyl-tRNA(Asn)/glutamyl-tRNA(Gln) amidotransferase subunit C
MISKDEVKKLAWLSRLTLSDDERARLSTELSDIIGYAEKLGNLDLAGVTATAHAVAVNNVFRPDEPRVHDIIDKALANAPEHDAQGRFFRVPKVIG